MKKPKFDIGYGLSIPKDSGRIINKSGEFNIRHDNRKFHFRDIYHYLINTSWTQFFFWILLGYFVVCFLFAFIYINLGDKEIKGIEHYTSYWDKLLHCFYFSTQTFTTVGYGGISPFGHWASIISSLQALFGLLLFSFASGLFYGRFSKAEPNLKFSDHLYHRDFKGEKALMFRIMHRHHNVLNDLRAEIYLLLKSEVNGKFELKYFPMKLEREKLTVMPLTWTIVMLIDEDNPLFIMTQEDIMKANGEFIIVIKYYDGTYSEDIYQRYSYTMNEIKFDYAFKPAHSYDAYGNAILHHDLLENIEEMK